VAECAAASAVVVAIGEAVENTPIEGTDAVPVTNNPTHMIDNRVGGTAVASRRGVARPHVLFDGCPGTASPVSGVIFESRIFGRRPSAPEGSQRRTRLRLGRKLDLALVAVAVILILIAGEVVAVRVLLTGEPSELQTPIVTAALSFALALLAGRTLADALREGADDLGQWSRERAADIAVGTALVVFIGSYLVLDLGT
jgi:hypothetical protein